MGIEAFNDACRESVLRYTHEWQEYVTRQARWVDFDNDYKTLDLDYMESVMWAFKTLWDKGLIYEGYRVLWYCTRCETPLSATETKMDDTYRSRQDPAVTVSLRLRSADPALDGVQALVWTTTPVDPAVQPGRRGRTRTSSTSWSSRPGPVRRAATCWPPPGLGAYARELGEDADGAGHVHRRAAGRHPATRRRSTSSSAGRTPTRS